MAHGTQSTAFVRQRKLPLPCLVGALLSQGSQSQQLMLDSFFASLAGHAGLERVASDRAFAQARNKLKPAALTALNSQLLDLAQARGWMPLWHGLRVVAADASVFMPATRACHQMRLAAQPDQHLFGLSSVRLNRLV